MEGVGEVVEVMAAEQGSGGGPLNGWGVRLGGRSLKLRQDLLGDGGVVPVPVWRRLSRRP